jgi:hypothetical protein
LDAALQADGEINSDFSGAIFQEKAKQNQNESLALVPRRGLSLRRHSRLFINGLDRATEALCTTVVALRPAPFEVPKNASAKMKTTTQKQTLSG